MELIKETENKILKKSDPNREAILFIADFLASIGEIDAAKKIKEILKCEG